MDHHRRGKRTKQHHQQQSQAGPQRSEDAFITEPQRLLLAEFCKCSYTRTCPLTVSTRGIGLVISRVTSVLQQRLRLRSEDIPVAAIYRASLAQLQAKMSSAGMMGFRNVPPPFQYESRFLLDFDTEEVIRRCHTVNLCQVALIIDSIGNVEVNDKTFTPVFFKELSPLNIRLDNLRKYCDRMSNRETDPSERIEGYELNSIPNASWERMDVNDEKSIVLTNPDEIIPPDYDWNNRRSVCDDLNMVSNWLSNTSRFIPELKATIHGGNEGDPGMLVSTHVIPGQSLKVNNEVISGTQKEFWSLERIAKKSWCVGAFGLVGETLSPLDGSARSNVVAMRTAVDWHEICSMVA